MARDTDDSEDQAEASHAPRECMPCRGTGQVISNLGGTQSSVACPWCGGAGMRVAGVDAQAGWPPASHEDAAASASSESAA